MRGQVEFEIVGRTALLMHADSIEASDLLSEWRNDDQNRDVSVPGDDRSPAWTWQTYLYVDPTTGMIAIPWENISAALRGAGTQMKLKGTKTFKAEAVSAIQPTREFHEFLCKGKPVPIAKIHSLKDEKFAVQKEEVKKLGFVLHQKRAQLPKGGKNIRVRARFDEWSVRGVLSVDSESIDMERLTRLFEIAGLKMGLCDWRPGSTKSPGPFGMFALKSLKLVK